ncbi:MAG: TolC family protein [Chlorobi bacterium]|nr:TolC family protein [Chlorobiota bacterium]
MHRVNERLKSLGLSFLMLLGISNAGRAQQSDTLVVSFNEALQYATENAYQSKSAGYDIAAAQKQVWEYLSVGFPQVNMAGGLNDNLSIQENYITMEDEQGNKQVIKIKFGSQYSWNVGGTIDQLLLDGSYFLGVKASRIFVEMARHKKQKTEIDVRENVAKAYLVALVAKKNLTIFKQNLKVNEQTLKETEALYKNGFREELDVDQIRLMVNNSKNMVLEAERQLMVAKAVLKFSMGLKIETPLVLNDELDNLIVPVLSEKVDMNAFDVNNMVDYTISETQEEIQRLKMKNEQAQYYPKLNAFYSYTHYEFGDKLSQMNTSAGQVLGLKLSMPIFTTGRRHAIVSKEKMNLLKVQNEKMMMEENLKREFLVASTNLLNAREKYSNDKYAVDIAERVYDKTRIKFKNGLSSSTELSQNEGQFIKSQISFIQSTLNVLDNFIQYRKALGSL